MRGAFITFEGPDGSGKTTQLRRVTEALQECGIHCVVTREPGGTRISDAIREILLNPDNKSMDSRTEVLLYAASRAQLVAEVIRPALDAGNIVLCDRYIDASIAYQSKGLGVAPELVRGINEEATGGLWPDRTYMIDVPAQVGLARVREARRAAYNGQLDRIEQRDIEYHERVREAFVTVAREEEQRCLLIDGTEPLDTVFQKVWGDIRRFLHI